VRRDVIDVEWDAFAEVVFPSGRIGILWYRMPAPFGLVLPLPHRGGQSR
jgi:hypothetical protein